MVPTVAVARYAVVIEVSGNTTVVATVAIDSSRATTIRAVAAADWASVAIAVVVAVETWSPGAVVAGVTGVVVTWSSGVIRGVRLAHLNTQASGSERKSLCFRLRSIDNREQADREYRCCNPFDECGHGGASVDDMGLIGGATSARDLGLRCQKANGVPMN